MPESFKEWLCSELFNQAPMCISVIDRDFRVVDANKLFTETFGPWNGQHCYAVYKDRSERCERCGAARTFADGQTRVREEQGVNRHGVPYYYVVHLVPIIHPTGEIPYVIEMSTDITAVKKLEQEKLEAERLAAVGQTVAGLAHGIKNIIMGLEGGMYVVGSGLRRGDNDRVRHGWEMLDDNIKRISAFVKEFLSFARGAKAQVAPADPAAIARQVIDLFRDKAALAGIDLRGELQDGVAPAPMDAAGIHTCLANLVSNALDACEVSDQPERRVTLSVREQDGVIVYEVADNGVGMDYEIKQKVFTNFFSTKGSGKGTGLGLLTTRKIVQEHGGSVAFESEPGAGSLFRLAFPRDRLPQPPRQEETRESEQQTQAAQ